MHSYLLGNFVAGCFGQMGTTYVSASSVITYWDYVSSTVTRALSFTYANYKNNYCDSIYVLPSLTGYFMYKTMSSMSLSSYYYLGTINDITIDTSFTV